MAITRTELSLSKEVAATTEDCVTFIPAIGDFWLTHFLGEAAYSVNTAVKVVWDYGGTEEMLISTKGSLNTDLDIKITGDGIKKIAVCLDNGETGAVVLTGMIKIVQET